MVVYNFPSISPVRGESLLSSDKTELPFGRKNIIINAKSDRIRYASHSAPLSVKLTLKGSEIYELQGACIKVDSSNFLLLNNGSSYSSYIDSETEVESFCFFFKDGFIEDIRSAKQDCQLEISPPAGSSVNFYEKLHPIKGPEGSKILSLVNLIKSSGFCDGIVDEIFYLLGEIILDLNNIEFRRSNELKYEKKSTRDEIYRRLCRTRDYIESNFAGQITLEDISNAGCLSKYYLIKIFKSHFGMTPYQFLSNCRLDKARELIETSDLKISQVVLQLGFENLSSFTRLFKRKFGRTPTSMRR